MIQATAPQPGGNSREPVPPPGRGPEGRGPAGNRRRSGSGKPESSRLYRQLAPAYEAVWPLLARRRVWSNIRALGIPAGAKVLDVGVGTGMSLQGYPRHADVTGIDLSEEMLEQARRKIAREGWNHIHLRAMNAQKLEFPDATFDFVTAFHVISVVQNPRAMMGEIVRVCRPGGRILIINHFRSQRPWLAKMIDRADPVTRHLGWRTNLACQELLEELPLEVERQYKTSPMSLFTVLRATRRD